MWNKATVLRVLENIGEKLLEAIFITYDFNKEKIVMPPIRLYRRLWLYLKYDMKPGDIYFNPPTTEVIQVTHYGIDYYGDVVINFDVLRAGRVNRTYTEYEWDDFVNNFYKMRKLTPNEELLYGIR